MIHFTTNEGQYLGFLFEMRSCLCNKSARKKDTKEANTRLFRPQLRKEKFRMFMDQELISFMKADQFNGQMENT